MKALSMAVIALSIGGIDLMAPSVEPLPIRPVSHRWVQYYDGPPPPPRVLPEQDRQRIAAANAKRARKGARRMELAR